MPQVTGEAMAPMAAAGGEWLTLEQASRRLGVHSTTLRRWANMGAIDVFLTPGGHRRFRLQDLQRFEQERRRSRLPVAAQSRWGDYAIAHAREEIPKQRWVAVYDESEREIKRQLGRRLIGIVLQFIARTDEGTDLLEEAHDIGEQHAHSGLRLGQPLIDLLQAISFFRSTLLELAIVQLPQTVAAQPEASTRLLRRIERLVDEVQSGVVEVYTGANRCG